MPDRLRMDAGPMASTAEKFHAARLQRLLFVEKNQVVNI
jgi:hypothetical protein